MKKRLFALLLSLVLCIGTVIPAMAGGEESQAALTVGGVTMKPDEANSGEGWSYDGNYNLTLNGYNFTDKGIYFTPYDGIHSWLNVIVQGENSLDIISLNSVESTSDGPEYGYFAKLKLSGNGTLNLTASNLLGTGQNEKLVTVTAGSNIAIKLPDRGTAMGEYAQVTIEKDAVLTIVEDNAGGSLGSNRFHIQGGTLDITQNTQETYWMENSDTKGCVITDGGMLKVTRNSDQPAVLIKAELLDQLGLKATDGDGNPGYICDLNSVGNGHIGPSPDSDYSSCYSTVIFREVNPSSHEGNNSEENNPGTEPETSAFTDVTADAYYAAPVEWAVAQGITSGTSDTTFSPDDTCTKAQIITFLWRAAGSPEPQNTAAFSDVTADAYYAKATAWAAENGMAEGSTFDPEAPCTRLMAVEFMWKHAGSPSAAQASFADVTSDAVNWALEQGVTAGTSDATFSPDDTCTRGQIVTFLYRAFA